MKQLAAALALALSLCGCIRAQTASTEFRVIPITNTTTGAPEETGKLIFRGLAGNTITFRAPDAITASFEVKWPTDNVDGCLSNTMADATHAELSFGSCGLTNPMTSEGDLITGGASGVPSRLAHPVTGGTNFLVYLGAGPTPTWQNVLFSSPLSYGSGIFSIQVANGSQSGYLTSSDWNTFNGKMTNPMTATGDLITRNSGGSPARIVAPGTGGTNFLVFQGAGPTPTWQNVLFSSPLSYGSGIFSIQVANGSQSGYLTSSDWNTFNGKVTNPMTATGDLITRNSGGSPARIAAPGTGGTNFLVFQGAGPTPTWQNVLFSSPLSYSSGIFSIQVANGSQSGYLTSSDWNAFNGKMTNPMTATGDLIYGGTGGSPTRLGKPFSGTNFLVSIGGGSPTWQNIIASSPLAYSSGVFTCATCLTTSGSQILTGNYTITGNLYNRDVGGASTGISCSGVANGWTGITNDNYVVICYGGFRYRAALTSY